jgi:putative transposase
LRNDRIEAPCLFDGPINGERLRAQNNSSYPPEARRRGNPRQPRLSQGKSINKAIRDAGARLVFLPKYSPDLNPIEQVFAKFKNLLRKAKARTCDAVSNAHVEILAQYTPAECANDLKNAGYAPSKYSPL